MQKSLFLVFVLIFFSCSDHMLDRVAIREKKNEDLKAMSIANLASNYNVLYRWDTLDAHNRRDLFTINFNPIIKSSYQIVGKFKLTDVYEKDSIYYISIVTGVYRTFYFDLSIDAGQERLLTQKGKQYILLIKVDEIRKIKNVIEGNLEDEKTQDISLNLNYSTDFIGRGKIIKIVSIDNLTE